MNSVTAAPKEESSAIPIRPFILHTRIVNGVGGGPEKTIFNSPRHLPELGYDSACLYLYPEGDPGIEALKQKAVDAQAEMIAWPDGAPIDFGLVKRLQEFCKTRNVAVWHAHDYKTNVLGLLVRRGWPMKLVTTTHGWCVTGWKSHFYALAGKSCLPFHDAVVSVSNDLYRNSQRWHLSKRRVHLIPNAIDTSTYRRTLSCEQARVELPEIACEGIVIAALGRLSIEKGFQILVDSVDELRRTGTHITLWIGGEGGCRQSLEQQIQRLGLQRQVLLLGHVNDPRTLLQAADIFVLSSISEGLPNVVLEAMSLETPVVATRVAGVPSLIEHDQNGLLVDPGDPLQLAQAIRQLANDPNKRDLFAQRARKHVVSTFSFTERMKKIAYIYDQILQ